MKTLYSKVVFQGTADTTTEVNPKLPPSCTQSQGDKEAMLLPLDQLHCDIIQTNGITRTEDRNCHFMDNICTFFKCPQGAADLGTIRKFSKLSSNITLFFMSCETQLQVIWNVQKKKDFNIV